MVITLSFEWDVVSSRVIKIEKYSFNVFVWFEGISLYLLFSFYFSSSGNDNVYFSLIQVLTEHAKTSISVNVSNSYTAVLHQD